MARRKMPSEEEAVATATVKESVKKRQWVRENGSNVRIRTAPRIDADFTGNFLGDGWHEIDDVQPGKGSPTGWGHLVSGVGWVALYFCTIKEE